MYTSEQLVDGLLDHMLYLHIAHHVAGRIRVKASWNGAQKLGAVNEDELTAVIAGIPGIVDYRVNKKALSVIIEYDTDILPPALWEEVAAVGQYPGRRGQVREQLLALLQQDSSHPRSFTETVAMASADA
ncbi:hypothetical protein [Desulfobulbus propionicus]|jgi:hypothetical protein